ncbi:Flagellar motor switch protein FliG [compost metagenome]
MSENRVASKLNKVDKAAILLLSLGETDAAQVLRHLGPKEVQRVGVAMAQMRNIQREQVEQVMGEFVDIVGDQTSLGVGADSYIRRMLTQALGEDKAGNLIDRILLGGSTSGLDSLKWMEPRAVADVIRYEHPQIQAIVVAYDNLADVDDRGIQALLREVSSDVLVLALKGSDDAVKDKIFKNMSKRAAELLRDDLEARGPVRVSEVEAAQKEILTIARRMSESGEIVLGGKGGEEML